MSGEGMTGLRNGWGPARHSLVISFEHTIAPVSLPSIRIRGGMACVLRW